MTIMIDEDVLARLFEDAALGFEPPAEGPDAILGAAIEQTTSGLESPLVRLRRYRAERTTPPIASEGDDNDDEDGGEVLTIERAPAAVRRISGTRRVLGAVAALAAAAFLAFLLVPGSSSHLPMESHIPTHLAAPVTSTTVPSGSEQPRERNLANGLGGGGGGSTGQIAQAGGSPGLAAFGSTGLPSTTKGAASTPPATSETPGVLPGSIGSSSKIEETGTLALTVPRNTIQTAVDGLYGVASEFGGFVASSDVVSAVAGVAPATATITLQIPVDDFGTALVQAKKLGRVGPFETHAADVTGQYVDLQARITAAKDSLQQYLTIMTKATTIGQILAVQAQVDSIQSDIEQLQGQLQVLDSQTTYSTLTVSLSEPALPVKTVHVVHHHKKVTPPESGISRAWHDSVSGFVSGIEWLIRDAGRTLFVLLFLAALFLLGRWGWRAGRRRAL